MARAERPNMIDQPIYQLRVALAGPMPPVWRRVQVRSGILLPRLHEVLQAVMGWQDQHLHRFVIGGAHYQAPDDEYDPWLQGHRSEQWVRLDDLIVVQGANFSYEYDFGDSWQHRVMLEKILPPDPGGRYPVFLAGRRACPPEDSGGPVAYECFLAKRRGSTDPFEVDNAATIASDFDPEALDSLAIEARLRPLQRRASRAFAPRGTPKGAPAALPPAAAPRTPGRRRPAAPPLDLRPLSLTAEERALTALHRMTEGHDYSTPEQLDALLTSRFGRFSLWDNPPPEAAPRTAGERAQEMAWDAMDADDPVECLALARRALALDPDCADALRLSAGDPALSDKEVLALCRRAAAAGKRALGNREVGAAAGRLWSMAPVRPYLRALGALGVHLQRMGRLRDAATRFDEALWLDADDHLGVRYALLYLHLQRADLERAEDLLEAYAGDPTAWWAYGRALHAFLSEGDTAASRRLLRKALQVNPFVAACFWKMSPFSDLLPDSFRLGSEEEAQLVVYETLPAWARHFNAVAWLMAFAEKHLQAARDSSHIEHEEKQHRAGGPFDPDAFDAAEVDEALRVLAGSNDMHHEQDGLPVSLPATATAPAVPPPITAAPGGNVLPFRPRDRSPAPRRSPGA